MAEDLDLLLSQLGLRITQRRQQLGLTQAEVADRSGITRVTISRIEYGHQNLTLGTLCKLADALDTTVLELMGGPPPPSPSGG